MITLAVDAQLVFSFHDVLNVGKGGVWIRYYLLSFKGFNGIQLSLQGLDYVFLSSNKGIFTSKGFFYLIEKKLNNPINFNIRL